MEEIRARTTRLRQRFLTSVEETALRDVVTLLDTADRVRAAVMALHPAKPFPLGKRYARPWCVACRCDHPCPTVRALDGEVDR